MACPCWIIQKSLQKICVEDRSVIDIQGRQMDSLFAGVLGIERRTREDPGLIGVMGASSALRRNCNGVRGDIGEDCDWIDLGLLLSGVWTANVGISLVRGSGVRGVCGR